MRRFLLLFVLITAGFGARAITAAFNTTHLTGCAPLVDSFTDASTGNPVSWSWNFGNGGTSALQNPTASFNTPGSFTVSLTVTNSAGQSSTITHNIVVNPAPVVAFTADDTTVCPGTTVNFSSAINFNNASGSGLIVWNLNGSTASTPNTSYTYYTPGLYAASLSAANNLGCTTTVFKPAYIQVYQPPVVSISALPATICTPGGSTTLTANSTGSAPYTYAWALGDGSSSNANPVTHAYTALGSYPATVIVTDVHGCSDTAGPYNVAVVQLSASMTAPSSVCRSVPATFVNTTQGATSTSWNFGDGSTGTGSPASHIYSTAGTYTVTLVAGNGFCSDTTTQTIIVNPSPVAAFTYTPAQPCPAPVVVQFNNTSAGAASYAWDFGDTTFSTSASPLHTYQHNGYDTVLLTATSAAGCVSRITQVIAIYPLNVGVYATPQSGCIPLAVVFSSNISSVMNGAVVPYPYAITSMQWNFGDGGTATGSAPSHTFTAAGTYPATYTITTANGCSVSGGVTIKAGIRPTAGFSASTDTVCIHQPVQFTDLSTGIVNEYYWDFGDGNSSLSSNPQHIYTTAGTYTVTLVAGYNGCKDTLVKLNYVVALDPKSAFIPHYSCDTPLKVTFQNTGVNYTSCYWLFGDGTTSTVVSPVHIYPGFGYYTAQLITHNATTGCTDTATALLHLYQLSPAFTADDTTVCIHESVTFTPVITGGIPANYEWYVDNVLVDTAMVLVHPFNTGGYHTIRLKITDEHACTTALTRTNYILVGAPVAAWTAQPPVGCAPATIHFTDATTYPAGTFATSRFWSFGDGSMAAGNLSPVPHLYPSAGTYDISLVVTDNIGCKDSISTPGGMMVHHVAADFSVSSTTVCAGTPITFQNLSQGGTIHSWDFGDGTTSALSSPAHAYAQPGTYTVKLVELDGAGCSDSITKVAYVQVQAVPAAAFSLSDTFAICPPLIVQTTNTSTGGSQYAWSFGNTATSTLQNPAATYAAAGIYSVRLIVSSTAGCRDTAYGQVRILGYAGVMSYTPLTGCSPLTVVFTAHNVSNVPGFIFDFADGTTQASTSPTVTHTYTQAGPHLPKLILTDNAGCAATSYGLDTIKVDGIIPGFTFSPYPACVSGTLTFLDTSRGAYTPIASHNWIFHDGSTATGISATHTYTGPGNYAVTLITSTAGGCRDTLQSSVTFWTLPVISAGPDTTICLGDTATLHPSGGVSYTWLPPAALSCANCANPFAFPTVQTQYTVTGADAHGCTNRDSIIVKIKTKTDGQAGAGAEVCAGIPVSLSASGGNVYTWIPATGLNDSHSATPTATPAVTTHYVVIIKEGSCIADTAAVDVIIHPLPVADAGPPQTIIAGDMAQLTATGSTYITNWAWTPAATLSNAAIANPEATPKATTTYTVTAKTDFNCEASDTVTVFVICDNSQVFIPNTFTPNGNGHNDKFYVHGKGISTIKYFRVYDRWGEVVFERQNIQVNDEAAGWDGTFNGKMLPPDVYVYLLDAICDTGEESQWKGDVMLLR